MTGRLGDGRKYYIRPMVSKLPGPFVESYPIREPFRSGPPPRDGTQPKGPIPMEVTKKNNRTMNIVATAQAAPKLKTFSKAIKAAGLESTLEGRGPFTVFAPTDDAFGKLPTGELDALLEPQNKSELANLLKHHIVSGNTTAAVTKTVEVRTLDGSARHLRVDSRGVAIDDSSVTQADIACTNGVIHAIDKVVVSSKKQ
jgi:uncharacterized surface protein with fasciclin (FAS1) repeats